MVDTAQPAKPEKPTAAMRVILGGVIAILASYTAVPVILVVAFLFALGLTCGAAVALEHTGTLDDAAAFEIATWTAVVALALFFIVAFAHRRLAPQAKGTLAIVLRSPVVTAGIGLPLLTVVTLEAAWNTKAIAPLTGAIVLAALYFYSVAALVVMLYLTWLGCKEVYSFGAASKYRTGLTTGALLTPLAALLVIGYAVAPTAPSHAATGQTWADRVAPASAPGVLETERQALHQLDQAIENTHATPPPSALPPAVGPSTTSPTASPPPTATAAPLAAIPTATAETRAERGLPESDELVRACMNELATPQDGGRSQVDQVKAHLQARYAVRPGDAHDIVQDALFSVCETNLRKHYEKLGAVLKVAGERRASKWRRQSRRTCPIDGEPPSCTPSPDEFARFAREDDVMRASLCAEDDVTQDIITMHVIEGKTFATIGEALDLTEAAARWRYNNARNKLQRLLRKACDR